MKAIRVNKQGGPEILSYEDVEVTEPGEGEAVGEGVEEISQGDYVAFAGVPGAYAEYIIAPAERLVPFNVTLVEARIAAAVMLQGMTAHYLTHSTFPLQEG